MSLISDTRAAINIIEERNKKIAELEEKLKERDSVRLWNENEELKAQVKELKIHLDLLRDKNE